MPDPIIKKPYEYFDVITYTGDGTSSRNITGLNFQPDFVWIKVRSLSTSHALTDSVREAPNQLSSNSTGAEVSDYYYGGVSAFLSNGFTVVAGGGGSPRVNESGQTYVAWCWKANGTGVSNTAGSITSTVSANTTSGFSVVTYTGTGANATVGHGLGVAPKMIIFKNRSVSSDWPVYHGALGATYEGSLNTTAAFYTSGTEFQGTNPTSSVFYINGGFGVNNSGNSMVAYCFSEVAGFSKFTSFTGNGSTDGPFVYCGFRPKFIMFKNTTTANRNWEILDTSRDTYNAMYRRLFPNASNAEDTGVNPIVDYLSNGFKMRTSDSAINGSGQNYIIAAFAESPFKYSLAR